MKKWTVVIELTEDLNLDAAGINEAVSEALTERIFHIPDIQFQIMETIEAPYGPQHPNGVFLDERHMPKGRRP